MVLSIRHNVRDFDAWYKVFQEQKELRSRYGCIRDRVFRNVEDPTEVVVLADYPGREHAQQFLEDPDLAPAMAKAGVIGSPVVTFADSFHMEEPAPA